MLIRDNSFKDDKPNALTKDEEEVETRMLAADRDIHINNSNIYTSNANKYKQPRFTVYEIDYSHGYNKGDAHFLNLERGKYYLRIKS